MANAQITYDSKTIALRKARMGLNPIYVQDKKVSISSSGIIETIGIYDIIRINFTGFFTQQLYYDLIAWWAWAKQGQAFAFAFDTDRVASTTLDAGAAAAQKEVPLTATAGISAGEFLYLKKASDDESEVIEVDSVDAGVKVVAVENLKYTYVSGDGCRHVDYFPALKTENMHFNPQVVEPSWAVTESHYYTFTFKFVEDKS